MKNTALIFVAVFLCLCSAVSARDARFAGQFYPADKQSLSVFIDEAMAAADPLSLRSSDLPAKVLGVVVPHAGYSFSGRVAAFAYKTISADYDLIVILGVGHTMRVRGAALLAKGYYETPLGRIPVDEKLAADLIKASSLFEDLPEAHANEHSIEVQLPFLQRRLKKSFKILPAVLNTDNPEDLAAIGRIIGKKLKGRKALLVVSTDLSHYPKHEDARLVDGALELALRTMDPGYFQLTNRVLLSRGVPGLATCACGEAALTAALSAVKEIAPTEFVALKYADSYDANPADSPADRVVGYLAGAFVIKEKADPYKMNFTKEQRQSLLAAARAAVARGFEPSGKMPALSSAGAFLNLPAAVFVTLTEGGRLRGCVGTVEPRMPLFAAVDFAAESAAFHDSRFQPLKKPELEGVKVEISVLSRLEKITDAKAIKPGEHGVVASRGGRSGLFLPQVWEQIPGKEDFLSELCSQKAGLERNCWQDKKTELYIFTVDSFKE